MEQKKAANPSIEEVLAEKDANKQKEIYNEYVSNMTPKHSCFWNCIKAFSCRWFDLSAGRNIDTVVSIYG